MMILEWEELMKLIVERLRVSHTSKFYTIELPSAYSLHQLMSGVVSALAELQLLVGGYCGCPDGVREVWVAVFMHVKDKGVKLGQKGKGSQQAN